jgi:hypothetical protein
MAGQTASMSSYFYKVVQLLKTKNGIPQEQYMR